MKQERVRLIKMIATLSVLGILTGVIQIELFGRLGWTFVPDLAFALVMGIAFYLGAETGGIFGIGMGVLMDMLCRTQGVHILPTVYLLCGYICGKIAQVRFPDKTFPEYLSVLAVSVPLQAGITLLRFVVQNGNIRSEHLVTRLILPGALSVAIAMLAFCFPFKYLCRRLKA